MGKKRYWIYQLASNARTISNLKNRWADNGYSPLKFYNDFFKKYSRLSYEDFCFLINWDESITLELEKAIDDFWEVSK